MAGHIIMNCGQTATALYFVARGEVEVLGRRKEIVSTIDYGSSFLDNSIFFPMKAE